MVTDLVIVALAAGMGWWGYSRGADIAVLAAAGFGVGAVIGSRIGPQLLDGGIHDPLAPAAGLPGGLLLGGVMAAAFERAGYEAHRRWLRRRHMANAITGAVLAVLLGVVVVWILGAVATRVDALASTVEDSEIVAELNSALPPPGPVRSDTEEFYLEGPTRSRLLAEGERIRRDPQVEAARGSVLKVAVTSCGGGVGGGSGWVAADGIVMTNAHVVNRTTEVTVRPEGERTPLKATPISYSEGEDLALLRVPGVRRLRPLRLARTARPKSRAAILGFPNAKHYKARAALVGPTVLFPVLTGLGGPIRRTAMTFLESEVLGPAPGSSGGPVVDGRGHVIGTISLGFGRDRRLRSRVHAAIAIPVMRSHLRRGLAAPRPGLATGTC